MKILLTGANGYIGKRLLPELVKAGHQVVCGVRDLSRFEIPPSLSKNVQSIELDLLKKETLKNIPKDIDGAYYLVHSMSTSDNYDELESRSASNFRDALDQTNVKHVVYLSGIINESTLSKHLTSRKNVEIQLEKGNYSLTTLRAGIIVGSGSASFEIIRDLVEKLPIMVTPKWLNTKCQPIGITDVILFLSKSIFNENLYDKNYDIGGLEILTYKEMLLNFSTIRGLKRWIFTVPVMTPKLSSYWLYFVTSTSYKLAVALVHSMKVNVICRNDDINRILDIKPQNYQDSIKAAFSKIESRDVLSSWKDSFSSGRFDSTISEFVTIPKYGCYLDERTAPIRDRATCVNRIWQIGGSTGWYYMTWLWRLRGFMDKLVGGVGLRRGRTNNDKISVGDALDFWRVLYANKDEGRLLLFAEMKLPGEAWLEFRVQGNLLVQTATFRPKGLLGRSYWFTVSPLHAIIFEGMLKKLVASSSK